MALDVNLEKSSPANSPSLTTRGIAAGFEEETQHRLAEITKLRESMQENFHLYQEVLALPPEDREAMFQLLWEAQGGDSTILQSVHDLVYDEVPVDMEEFVLGRRYLGLRGLINAEKIDILNRFDQPHVRKGFLAIGSGGGKSFLVSVLMARQVYRLLCLKRPDLYYLLGPGSKIAIINLSVSKEQARHVIFAEFLARIEGSPWFKGKYEPLSASAIFDKKVYAFSGGSTATSYYGYHTIFGSLDEASFLVDRSDRSVAEELSEALLKSLNTRFPRAFKLLVISTLRSMDDFLYTQIQRVKEDGVRLL